MRAGARSRDPPPPRARARTAPDPNSARPRRPPQRAEKQRAAHQELLGLSAPPSAAQPAAAAAPPRAADAADAAADGFALRVPVGGLDGGPAGGGGCLLGGITIGRTPT